MSREENRSPGGGLHALPVTAYPSGLQGPFLHSRGGQNERPRTATRQVGGPTVPQATPFVDTNVHQSSKRRRARQRAAGAAGRRHHVSPRTPEAPCLVSETLCPLSVPKCRIAGHYVPCAIS